MKSLVRWSVALAIFGNTILGSQISGNLKASALPEGQIEQKLGSVPVFVITNHEGLPLSRTLPNDGKNGQNAGSVTGVYLSQQEAQAFVDELRNLKDKDPKTQELVKNLQVTTVPLTVIYKQARDNAKQPNHLVFAFKPVQADVDAALALLRQSGQKINQFDGVPIFAVRFGPDKGYVPIKMRQDNKEIIPLFLSKEDAQNLLGQVQQKFKAADIQVLDVDSVINTLRKKNDSWLNEVVIVPSPNSREFIRSIQQNPNSAAPSSGGAATQKPSR